MTVIIIASLLVVLNIHQYVAAGYGWTGMQSLRYILSSPFITSMIALCYVVYFAISFGLFYLIYWLL